MTPKTRPSLHAQPTAPTQSPTQSNRKMKHYLHEFHATLHAASLIGKATRRTWIRKHPPTLHPPSPAQTKDRWQRLLQAVKLGDMVAKRTLTAQQKKRGAQRQPSHRDGYGIEVNAPPRPPIIDAMEAGELGKDRTAVTAMEAGELHKGRAAAAGAGVWRWCPRPRSRERVAVRAVQHRGRACDA